MPQPTIQQLFQPTTGKARFIYVCQVYYISKVLPKRSYNS
jgi:hypothetical protein